MPACAVAASATTVANDRESIAPEPYLSKTATYGLAWLTREYTNSSSSCRYGLRK